MTSWSEDRVKKACTLWLAGYSGKRIALELGCGATRSSVMSKLSRLGLLGVQRPSRETVAIAPVLPAATSIITEIVHADRRRQAMRSKTAVSRARQAANHRAAEASVTGAITLDHLTPRMCRWPIGDKPYTFCGCTKALGSYCAEHARIAHPAGVVAKTQAWAASRRLMPACGNV